MRHVHTSITDPLRVDWLPLPTAERIGLTFAPGKRGEGAVSGTRWERDLDLDLERLRKHEHADVLVSLVEKPELDRWGIPDLFERARAHGLLVVHFPIRDAGVRIDGLEALVQDIGTLAATGRAVVIHCIGGLGRTGTIAGCVLVARGVHPDDALATLRRVRGSDRCPETEAQRDIVRGFANLRRPRAGATA